MRSLATPAGAFDPLTPNWARIHEYLTGGKSHFPPDRIAADRMKDILPTVATGLREQREFAERAVRHIISTEGVTQVLELGCGLPRSRNIHEIAAALTPDARTVYVSNDQMVLAHARALLAVDGLTTAVAGDLQAPQTALTDPAVRDLLDLDRPVIVLLVDVLHFTGDPAAIVADLSAELAPGSKLVLTHLCLDGLSPAAGKHLARVLADTDTPITPRPYRQIRALFSGLDLNEPGVIAVSQWRPDHELHHPTPQIIGGVGTWRGQP
ncbi:SAM-dependent methyltransferase [Planobispora takensis]|uniref:S-adenosyl methyltransferase n=1 Tax=Planobispora takensis TaxID=1367882 RepID=A0A8J3WRF6_9ACTN|nr:SAM-dependent methyltransferase [Planobispora takensis]GIH98072.1 hypothetical protein Pta02_00810 [Planobispora takensis]